MDWPDSQTQGVSRSDEWSDWPCFALSPRASFVPCDRGACMEMRSWRWAFLAAPWTFQLVWLGREGQPEGRPWDCGYLAVTLYDPSVQAGPVSWSVPNQLHDCPILNIFSRHASSVAAIAVGLSQFCVENLA